MALEIEDILRAVLLKELIIEHQVKAMNNVMNCITNTFETQILLIKLLVWI